MVSSQGGQSASADRYAKRLAEITRLIDDYVASHHVKSQGEALTLVDDPYKKVTDYYFRLLVEGVKPNLTPTHVHRTKMAACVELAIVDLQPIETGDTARRRRLNANLAIYCAVSFIESFTTIGESDYNTWDANEVKLRRLLYHHENWLRGKNPKAMPVFSDGMFWASFYLAAGYCFGRP